MSIIEKGLTLSGIIIILLWVFLFFTGKNRFKKETENAVRINKDKKLYSGLNGFLLPDMLFIGYRFMEIIGMELEDDYSKKKIREVVLLNGVRDAELYYKNVRAYEIMLFLTITPIMLILSGTTNKPEILLIFLGILIFIVRREFDIGSDCEKMKNEIEMDFPKVMSKLTILVSSGMVLRNAWQKVAMDGKGRLYEEMRITSADINNGVSEITAYRQFGERCDTVEGKKFASLISQNLVKGSNELVNYMTDLTNELWKEKELRVTKKTGEAVQKLLIPSVIIFIGILILILVPMFTNMNVL